MMGFGAGQCECARIPVLRRDVEAVHEAGRVDPIYK
jgi:hypothetical protein